MSAVSFRCACAVTGRAAATLACAGRTLAISTSPARVFAEQAAPAVNGSAVAVVGASSSAALRTDANDPTLIRTPIGGSFGPDGPECRSATPDSGTRATSQPFCPVSSTCVQPETARHFLGDSTVALHFDGALGLGSAISALPVHASGPP